MWRSSEASRPRVYQNMTEEAPFDGLLRREETRLCEGLTDRAPVLGPDEVERFLAMVVPFVRPGRGVIWILAGRTESNVPDLKERLKRWRHVATRDLLPLLQPQAG